jgi:hypothetical protein
MTKLPFDIRLPLCYNSAIFSRGVFNGCSSAENERLLSVCFLLLRKQAWVAVAIVYGDICGSRPYALSRFYFIGRFIWITAVFLKPSGAPP